jgi:hypothetical protein
MLNNKYKKKYFNLKNFLIRKNYFWGGGSLWSFFGNLFSSGKKNNFENEKLEKETLKKKMKNLKKKMKHLEKK